MFVEEQNWCILVFFLYCIENDFEFFYLQVNMVDDDEYIRFFMDYFLKLFFFDSIFDILNFVVICIIGEVEDEVEGNNVEFMVFSCEFVIVLCLRYYYVGIGIVVVEI